MALRELSRTLEGLWKAGEFWAVNYWERSKTSFREGMGLMMRDLY